MQSSSSFSYGRAQELESTSVANSGEDPSVVVAGSTMSPPEHNIITITELSEDKDIDDHPRPCKFSLF